MSFARQRKVTRCQGCDAILVRPRFQLSLFTFSQGWHRWGYLCRTCALSVLRVRSKVVKLEW